MIIINDKKDGKIKKRFYCTVKVPLATTETDGVAEQVITGLADSTDDDNKCANKKIMLIR